MDTLEQLDLIGTHTIECVPAKEINTKKQEEPIDKYYNKDVADWTIDNFTNCILSMYNTWDLEIAHQIADDILCKVILKYIPNSEKLIKAFEELDKWYA